FIVLLTMPMRDLAAEIKTIKRTIYLWLPVTLIVAGIGGFLLAGKSLSPVVAMSEQAARISSTNLHDRLKVKNSRDELGRLARVFNDLLSRLDQSFDRLLTFMADASHELRTPLAVIRGEADVALSQDRDSDEYKEALTVIQDEAARLSHIVNDMLSLARADAGQSPLNREEFYLNDLVDECCKSARILASSKGITIRSTPSTDMAFRGDQEMLRRLMMNLLDNAIKYTPLGGSVEVRVKQRPGEAEIEVSDTGIGIETEAAARVFERFYRADKARSRAEGGSGLGLSIAKWAAEAHGGSIHLTSQPGRGSTFTVRLPI
ncbi:MAG TPA: ATP-binding protein, partial [Blastocatellia bacterium]